MSGRCCGAVLVAALLGGGASHAQNAAGAAPAKPQCTVSDAGAPASAHSAAPAAAPAAATASTGDRKSTAPALSEDVRKTIFVELQQVVARAQREAAVAYPTGDRAQMLSPTNVEKPGKLAFKRETTALSLERTYLAELMARRSLACDAARAIMREGRAGGWPAKLEERSQK
jgi:hypothetical protein